MSAEEETNELTETEFCFLFLSSYYYFTTVTILSLSCCFVIPSPISDLLVDQSRQIVGAVAVVYLISSSIQYWFRWRRRPQVGPTHYASCPPYYYYCRRPRRLLRGRKGLKRYLFYPPNRKRRSGLILQQNRQQQQPEDSSDSGSDNSQTVMASEAQTRSSAAEATVGTNHQQSSSPDRHSKNNSHNHDNGAGRAIEKPVLVYHESARSIVFRDHVRRAVKKQQQDGMMSNNGKSTVTKEYVTELMDANRDGMMDYTPPDDMLAQPKKSKHNSHHSTNHVQNVGDSQLDGRGNNRQDPIVELDPGTLICNSFQPKLQPLPSLPLGASDEFEALLDSPTGENSDDVDPSWTEAEREVVDRLANQQALVKTIKNTDWTSFLHRFQIPNERRQHNNFPFEHDDLPPADGHEHNSFVTSCSLLPPFGKKMRCYGSPSQYTTGVVFALPQHHFDNGREVSELEAATNTKTWSWPAGYSAKTEFNIDGRGNLINGRQEALVSLNTLREYNNDYLTKDDHSTYSKNFLYVGVSLFYRPAFIHVFSHILTWLSPSFLILN